MINEKGQKLNKTSGVYGGGTPLARTYLFDGNSWSKAEAMLEKRVSPVCSLVEMDDGEVFDAFNGAGSAVDGVTYPG